MLWWEPFMAWLLANGAHVPSPALWEPAERQDSRGVGLVAARELSRDTLIFAVPSEAIVFAPDKFELAEWMVRERMMMMMDEEEETAEESCEEEEEEEEWDREDAWMGFVKSLPQRNEAHRWPRENVFFRAVEKGEVRLPKDRQVAAAMEFMPQWIEESGMEEEWLLSLALVTSRVHVVWARDPFGDWVTKTALVPLADLLNGVPKFRDPDNTIANVICQTRKSDQSFICTTTRNVRKGEELLVHYGDDSATELDIVRTYGI